MSAFNGLGCYCFKFSFGINQKFCKMMTNLWCNDDRFCIRELDSLEIL